MKVFLSVGATYNTQQEDFVKAFENYLSQNGCERLTVGRGFHTSAQPIVEARNLMQKADGVVVIGFTRQIIERAIEQPGGLKQTSINNRKIPTIWNQLESAMAFGLGLPLLLIIEEGLYQEAMLKDRLEYRALLTELDTAFFNPDEFKGVFSDWKMKAEIQRSKISVNIAPKSIIQESNNSEIIDPKSETIVKLFGRLSLEQFWILASILFGILSAVASAGFWVGKNLAH